MSRADFRPFLPAPGQSRIAGATPGEHTANRTRAGRAQELLKGWSELAERPFAGITVDGTVEAGLFSLDPAGAPSGAMTAAARALLDRMSREQRARAHLPVDSEMWRRWQNTELYLEDHGLRLDEAGPELRDAALDLLRAGLSPRGFDKTRAVMRLNGFLGELLGGGAVLGEWSFTLCLFGTPSESEPWGWQVFGHHLTLNCFVLGERMVLTPCFMGAEPAHADAGPHAGLSLFEDEEHQGLALMRSLTPALRSRALVSHSMKGEDLPPGRWHFADHLHLGGAYQDNRIVPYEGLPCDTLSARQRRRLLDLVECFVEPLPAGPLARRGSTRSNGICRRRISAGSAVPGRRPPSTTGSRARSFSSSSTTTRACSSPTPTRRGSTSTPSCARPTATTTASTCSASTTPGPIITDRRASVPGAMLQCSRIPSPPRHARTRSRHPRTGHGEPDAARPILTTARLAGGGMDGRIESGHDVVGGSANSPIAMPPTPSCPDSIRASLGGAGRAGCGPPPPPSTLRIAPGRWRCPEQARA